MTQEDLLTAEDYRHHLRNPRETLPKKDPKIVVDKLPPEGLCGRCFLCSAGCTDQSIRNSTCRRYDPFQNRKRPFDPLTGIPIKCRESLNEAGSHFNQDSWRQLASNFHQRFAHSNQSSCLAPLQTLNTRNPAGMAYHSNQSNHFFAMEDYMDFTLYDGDQDATAQETPSSLLSFQAEAALQGSPNETHQLFTPPYTTCSPASSAAQTYQLPPYHYQGHDSFGPTYPEYAYDPSAYQPQSHNSHLSTAPSSTSASTEYGVLHSSGRWKCAFPGCNSQSLFERGCDLRKHYKRHVKHLRCSLEGCPQSLQASFSSNKDLARHEAKHAPGVHCEYRGCGKVFSRRDNMRDHMRRIHSNQ